jgi:hypothetical protein
MSPVGFEPTIPVLERAKTVHALNRAATVIGPKECTTEKSLTQENIRLVNNAPKNNH